MSKDLEKEKYLAALEAVKFIEDNQIVGLGTGSSASHAVKEIGTMVKNGLKIQGVPTSVRTEELAKSLNIPLIDINEVTSIDITIDGADEFTDDLVLIKGGGGALLREKIVASMTRQEIIITDSTKRVEKLGKFPLPIEVIPFAVNYVQRKISQLNGIGTIRTKNGSTFITDQGNYIIDVDFGLIDDPISLSNELNKIEGIVCQGLFIGLASKAIMGISETDSTVVINR